MSSLSELLGPGIMYLIHFDRPYKHACHYLGWTTDLEKRIKQHREINLDNLDKENKNRGAVLLAYVNSAGIGWEVVRVWEGVTIDIEFKLKKNMHLPRYCPKCKGEQLRKAREQHKRRMDRKRAEKLRKAA